MRIMLYQPQMTFFCLIISEVTTVYASQVCETMGRVPMCLRVISTVALRLTLDSSPRQKRSEFEGSVKPSTVREG